MDPVPEVTQPHPACRPGAAPCGEEPDTPDISILSDEFLAEIQGMEMKNLALEALRKHINGSGSTNSSRLDTILREVSIHNHERF